MNIKNVFNGRTVEFNIIQPVAVNCLNRDDNNEPKFVDIPGGGRRQRISSQCWKRAIRMEMHSKNGIKCVSSQLLEIVKNKAIEAGAPSDVAEKIAKAFNMEFGKICSKDLKNSEKIKDNNTPMHISINEINAIINECKKDFAKCLDKKGETFTFKFNDIVNAVEKESDIAIFGRMIAANTNNTVEAAASFAHIISVNETDNFNDWYTAAIDTKINETNDGAINMGNTSISTPSVLYRYFNLDLGTLYKNKHGNVEKMKKDVADFIRASIIAMPSAHQKGIASLLRPSYIRVDIIDTMPHQIDFNEPINENIVKNAVDHIRNTISLDNEFDGSSPIKTFESSRDRSISIDHNCSLNEIINETLEYIDSLTK